VELVCLTAWGFRNLAPERISFDQGVNWILGENGEGKSNLLEAIAMLSSLRSFRTSHLRSVVKHGEKSFRLEAEIRGESGRWHLRQVVESGPPLRRYLSVNGQEVGSSQYLQVMPVFTLSSDSRELVTGSPQLRRSYIDQITFLLEPAHFGELSSYRKALRQRNASLTGFVTDDEMASWEELLSTSAASVVLRRLRSVARLQEPFQEIYSSLRGERFPDISVGYRHESWLDSFESGADLQDQYRNRYNSNRVRDRQVGFTTDGPHRHDLKLLVDGRPARDVLSAGQIKVVVAALRLAALAQVESDRSERLPVLVDDVDAELDRHVLSRLIDHLGELRQLFLSSAHGEMVGVGSGSASRLWIRQGACHDDCRAETKK
jgi:DNA replication and repair protein RecF